jgi:hypothetical protein
LVTDESVLVDGVRSVAFHNGVYRVAFFRIDTDGKPQHVLSLAVPENCAGQLLDAFNKMKR